MAVCNSIVSPSSAPYWHAPVCYVFSSMEQSRRLGGLHETTGVHRSARRRGSVAAGDARAGDEVVPARLPGSASWGGYNLGEAALATIAGVRLPQGNEYDTGVSVSRRSGRTAAAARSRTRARQSGRADCRIWHTCTEGG